MKKTNIRQIFNIAAIASIALVPAAYITRLHVNMFPKEDKINRKKMFNKMTGFLAGSGVATYIAHKALRLPSKSPVKKAAIITISTFLPFVGIESAKIINQKIYPKKTYFKKPVLKNQTSNIFKAFTPSKSLTI